MDYFRERVRAFILENFLFGDDYGLEDNASFLEESIIDSTGVIELVAFLEENFSIVVEEEEIIPENLDSILNVENFLKTKCSDKQSAKVFRLRD